MERAIYRALLLFGATVLVIWAFGLILWPFIVPIAWAVCLAAVTLRAYRALAAKTKKPRLSAGLMVLGTALTILGPLTVVGALVVGQARRIELDPAIENLREHLPGAVEWIDGVLGWFGMGNLQELAGRVPETIGQVLGGASVRGAISLLMTPVLFLFALAVTLITQYFLYSEAPRLRRAVLELSPLRPDDTDRILMTLRQTTSASVLGGLLVAIVQGALGGIGFAIAGIESPLVWAVLMMACSLFPFGGTALIWVPAALYLLAIGETGSGWFLMIWGAVIVGSSDNLLRPWMLTKTGAGGIHPLLLFFAILSGIGVFGISGIVFGPLLLALLVTVMQIYREHWPRGPRRAAPAVTPDT